MKLKVVFFGSSKHVIPIIEVLQKNFDLPLVATTEKLPTDPVPSYCIKPKVCYYVVRDFRNKKIINKIKEASPDIGILASFGAIIPNEVLNLFPHGIINIHPSLLPKYRGPSPIQEAILNGDKTTGVTIIKLDKQVDHGPILFQKEAQIIPDETAESLYERLFALAAGSMVQIIELYLKEEIKLREQNHSKATFTKRLARKDGYVNLQNPPKPEILNRMIHGYYPWPSTWTKWKMSGGARSRSARENGKWKIIKLLPYKKVQVEGRKPMSYKDFINGYPKIGKEILEKLKLS